MTRRSSLLPLAATLTACGRRVELPPGLFPESVAGVWRRTMLREVPLDEAPDPVPRPAVERIQAAVYQGAGQLDARVYVLDSIGTGQTLETRWRPSADTVFFATGRYFAVIKWQSADRKALQEFVRELQTRLGGGAPKKR